MDIVVFGSGRFYDNRKSVFDKYNVVAFLDNNVKKQGTYKNNILILKPEKISEIQYDYIIVTNQFATEMKEQLIGLGVEKDKICVYSEFINGCEEKFQLSFYYYGKEPEINKKKGILLLSHELSLTGAPVVILHLARLLKRLGYMPVVGSMKDGELRREILEEGIPLIICENMSSANQYFISLLDNFSIILANTIAFSNFINAMSGSTKPVIWWLHDIVTPELAQNQFVINEITDNISVYAGGKLVKEAYINGYKDNRIETFLYGVDDRKMTVVEKKTKKKIFAVIASIQPRKAQDIFVKAVSELPEKIRKDAEFWIIGKVPNVHANDYYNQIVSDAQKISEMKLLGEVDTETLWDLYNEIDVVVAPSRMDPMPVVVTNGLMLDKVCIISDTTGQAEFIIDGENGFVFQQDNVEELRKKMEWVIAHSEESKKIGENARKLFEQEFSMLVFEKKIERLIESKIE